MISVSLFGAAAIIASIFATFVADTRRAVLCLWLAGLALAGLYLDLGAEALALIQSIVATLGAIVALFFVLSFGEHIVIDDRTPVKRLATLTLPLLIGTGFSILIWLGMKDIPLEAPMATGNLRGLGLSILDDHLISAELLAVALLVSVVSAGVVGRPERSS